MDRKDQFIEWLKEKILSNPQEPPANAWDQISNSLDLEETWQEIGEELELEEIWQKVDTRLHHFEYLQLFERIGYAISGLAAIALLLGIWWGSELVPGLAEGEIATAYKSPIQVQEELKENDVQAQSSSSASLTEKSPAQTAPSSKENSTKRLAPNHSAKNTAGFDAAVEEPIREAISATKNKPGSQVPNSLIHRESSLPVYLTGNNVQEERTKFELLKKKRFVGFNIPEPIWPAIKAEESTQSGTVNPTAKESHTAYRFPAMVAGIGSAAKLSWLMNNKTLEALEKTSLVTAKPAVFTDVFLTYGVRLNKEFMLQADAYLQDWSGQRYQEYREGSYGAVEDRLLYRSLGLSLHKAGNQLGYGAMPVFSQLNAGIYAGALSKATETSVTGVSSKLNEYRKWHFGLQAGYGHDVFLNEQLMLTYGVRGRLDLLNIYSGTSAIPAGFRKTRNASLDFIMSLKYVLKK